MRLLSRLAATALPAAVLAACAPALDWRDVRPAGTALQMQFPCKPIAQLRQVALAGPAVPLALLACTADGQTWGLTHADVGDPARVTAALQQLRASAASNLASAPGTAPTRAAALPDAAAATNVRQESSTTAAPKPQDSGAPQPAVASGPRVPGSTPNAASAHLRIAGQLPDGSPVQMQLVVFAHGTRVFQATVLGERLPAAAADAYFASMAIRP